MNCARKNPPCSCLGPICARILLGIKSAWVSLPLYQEYIISSHKGRYVTKNEVGSGKLNMLFPCKNTISVSPCYSLINGLYNFLNRWCQVDPRKICENLKYSFSKFGQPCLIKKYKYDTANILEQSCFFYQYYWALLALWMFTSWIGKADWRGEIRQDIAHELSCSKRKRK